MLSTNSLFLSGVHVLTAIPRLIVRSPYTRSLPSAPAFTRSLSSAPASPENQEAFAKIQAELNAKIQAELKKNEELRRKAAQLEWELMRAQKPIPFFHKFSNPSATKPALEDRLHEALDEGDAERRLALKILVVMFVFFTVFGSQNTHGGTDKAKHEDSWMWSSQNTRRIR